MSAFRRGTPFVQRAEVVDSGCWIWRGYLNPDGYGLCHVSGVGTRSAHRVAFELFVGPIPEGLEIDHLCRNRACVNPDHLEPVTHQENVRRGDASPPLHNAAKTRCAHGHEFTDENTYRYKGRRLCRACNARSQREAYARKQAAS